MCDVLVVDGQPMLRGALVTLLERDGYIVRSAADGLEAVEVLRAEPCRLILLDLGIPRVNGQPFLGALRAEEQWASIPVVVLSTTIDPALATALGVARVLEKPVSDELLLETVVTFCSRRG